MDNKETHTEHCNHTIVEKNQENIFLYTTITGNLQLVHLEEIGYFRYNSNINCGKLYCIISTPYY